MSHNPLNEWSFEITWKIKKVYSPLPQCLNPPNLAALGSRVRGSQPETYVTIKTSGYMR